MTSTLSAPESLYRLRRNFVVVKNQQNLRHAKRQAQQQQLEEDDDQKHSEYYEQQQHEEQQQNERRQPLTNTHNQRWRGDGRGATNGSEDYEPTVEIVDGYPVDYSCDMMLRRGTATKKLEIKYDYEVSIDNYANFASNLRSLEWSTLWNVAEAVGLHNCDFTKQFSISNRQITNGNNRHLMDNSEIDETYIYNLSSMQHDRIDYNAGSCTLLVETRPGTFCMPVQGVMTAEYSGSKASQVKDFLLDTIAGEMDSGRVLTNEVSAVRFVGDRHLLVGSTATIQTLGVPQSEDRNRIRISKDKLVFVSALIVFVFVMVLAAAIFISIKRKRSEFKAKIARQNEIVEADLDSQSCMESAILDAISTETETETACARSLGVPDNDASSTTPLPDLQEEKQNQPKEHTATAESEMPNALKLDTIKTKQESQTLKPRRRRKKKKKKRPGLIRVSSRSNINEMDTIHEEGEEQDAVEEEYSDYSTDDDDSSAATQIELAATNSTGTESSDSDFICPINGSSGVMDETSPIGSTINPPSPIPEEPKIRKLPPPWI